MAEMDAYERYSEKLKNREKELREEIEQHSASLEKKVKSGLLAGLILFVASVVFYLIFGKTKKKKIVVQPVKTSIWSSKALKWVVEALSVEMVKRIWQMRKDRLKGS